MENYNTHMKLSWGLVHLGYNTPEKYGCFNTATYQAVIDTWQHTDPIPSESDILNAFEEYDDIDFAYPTERRFNHDVEGKIAVKNKAQ